MKLVFCIVLVFLAVFAHSEEDLKFGDDVEMLTKETFKTTVEANEFVFIVFYAPWCGHCKKLAPEYKKAAVDIKKMENVHAAAVDCTVTDDLCTSHGVKGFPTIKLFKNGVFFKDYQGTRTYDDILDFLNKKTGPVVSTITTIKEYEKMTSGASAVVLGLFAEKSEAFSAIADQFDDALFAEIIAPSAEVLAHFSAKEGEDIVIVKQPVEEEAVTIPFEGDDMAEKISNAATPLLWEVNQQTFSKIIEAQLPILVIFVKFDDDMKKHVSLMKKAATELKGKLVFGYSDADKFIQVYERLGGSKDNIPGIGALDVVGQKNYNYEGELNEDAILEYAKQLASGDVEAYLRSQEVPEDNSGAVFEIVGKTYEKEVNLDDSRDALVFVYAQWCGHCKSFKPTYEELAESVLPLREKILISRIDGAENDITDPKVKIQGFPTILFYKKSDKKDPIVYQGDRTIEDVKKFILDNADSSKEVLEALWAGEEEEKEETKTEEEEDVPSGEL